jgi:hypothetical protein
MFAALFLLRPHVVEPAFRPGPANPQIEIFQQWFLAQCPTTSNSSIRWEEGNEARVFKIKYNTLRCHLQTRTDKNQGPQVLTVLAMPYLSISSPFECENSQKDETAPLHARWKKDVNKQWINSLCKFIK